MAAGDINGDGTGDLIIGAPDADGPGTGTSCGTGQVGDRCGAGETYVIYGGTPGVDLPAVGGSIDLNVAAADLTVYGQDTGDSSGFDAAGDINGDGTEDLIIGGIRADPGGRTDAGKTYVIFGGPSLPPTFDLNSLSADFTVFGVDAGDESGLVRAGDINGDTTDDLIIGAIYGDPTGGTDAGETYVVYGGPSLPPTKGLSSTSAGLITVYGDDAGDRSGTVAVGNINGIGPDDLIVGAQEGDGSGTGTSCGAGQEGDRCQAGEIYVIYGSSNLPGTKDLNSTSADLTVLGGGDDDRLGASVASGDINGDGIEDLIVGAYSSDLLPERANVGKTYVVYGEQPPTATPTAAPCPPSACPLGVGGVGVIAGAAGVVGGRVVRAGRRCGGRRHRGGGGRGRTRRRGVRGETEGRGIGRRGARLP